MQISNGIFKHQGFNLEGKKSQGKNKITEENLAFSYYVVGCICLL